MRLYIFSLISLLILLLMASCQGAQPAEPSVTPLPLLATVPGTVYPLPIEPVSGEPTHEAYPKPGSEGQAGGISAYPLPGTEPAIEPLQPTATTLTSILGTLTPEGNGTVSPGGYPGPGSGVPTSTSLVDTYPGPESGASANLTSTIGPTETQSFAVPTGTQEAPVEEGTSAITATIGMVHTQLIASNPKDFHIASGELQLVEFFAFWSPISKSMAPVMNILEEKYKDRLHFVYLDIDDPSNSLFKLLLSNRLPPAFFLLDGEGNVLHEWQGYVKTEDFETVFESLP